MALVLIQPFGNSLTTNYQEFKMTTARTTLTTKLMASEIRVANLEDQLAAAIAALTAAAIAAATPATPVAPKRNPDLRDYSLPRYTDCSFSRPVLAVFHDLDEAFEYRAFIAETRNTTCAVRKCSAPNGVTVGAVY